MGNPPLWMDIKTAKRGSDVTVNLAVCRNCGLPKITSRPCSFDHLAAIGEFNATRKQADQ